MVYKHDSGEEYRLDYIMVEALEDMMAVFPSARLDMQEHSRDTAFMHLAFTLKARTYVIIIRH